MKLLKDHIYFFDTIIVGGNLASLVYSYINGLPIIITKPDVHESIYLFKPEIDLTKFGGIKNEVKQYITPEGVHEYGLKKQDFYYYLYYLLSMRGLIVFDASMQSIRIEEKNLLKIVSNKARLYSFKYKTMISFTKDITDFGLESELLRYDLVNYYDIKRSYKHDYTMLEKQENGLLEFGIFEHYNKLVTLTHLDKDFNNTHIDFYIKNYLEKYFKTFLKNHERHFIKANCTKTVKTEVYKENIITKDNIHLYTLSEERIINGENL
jgi:hypothetical protein